MYLLYADESGDTGLVASPTKYFILSGLVVHETRWRAFLDDIVAFRRHLRATKGLKLREEIHAAPFITNPGPLVRIKRNDQLDILKQCLDFLGNRSDISLCTVVVNKTTKSVGYDVFESAWQALIQRFDNTMRNRTTPALLPTSAGWCCPTTPTAANSLPSCDACGTTIPCPTTLLTKPKARDTATWRYNP
ncbi:DUF3800 domain-containing protein [Hymenobacter arizonensis]|uniref:DUF3800 domain-containing protein n=1 Tax=Hymenobacter arizonensis TaxID=1227077 RepID=A0A1I5ZPE4_HYMAR|nr:DUF3800 domain-containing protein [Hymenobacter arizonensis]SFQ58213.1 Protein of unknown function [Hymenobacter arizonensis]